MHYYATSFDDAKLAMVVGRLLGIDYVFVEWPKMLTNVRVPGWYSHASRRSEFGTEWTVYGRGVD